MFKIGTFIFFGFLACIQCVRVKTQVNSNSFHPNHVASLLEDTNLNLKLTFLENKQKEILKKLEKKGETCLLTDAPNQCSVFCLAALRPIIDNIVKLTHEMRIQSDILKETQASIRNNQNEVLNFPKILLQGDKEMKLKGMTGDENPVIPSGFRKIGTRYFHFSEDSANWTNARIGCQEKGGHLADFQNQEESIAFQSMLLSPHWLGIKAQDGNCVYIHGQSTYPSTCSYKIPYICQWDNKLN